MDIIRLSDVEVPSHRRDDDRAALIRTVTDIVPIDPVDLAVRIEKMVGKITPAEIIAMMAGRLRVPSRVVTAVARILAEELSPLQRFLNDRGDTIQSYCLPGRRPKS